MLTQKQSWIVYGISITLSIVYVTLLVFAVIYNIDVGNNKVVAFCTIVGPVLIIASLSYIAWKRSIKAGILCLISLMIGGLIIIYLVFSGFPAYIIKTVAFIITMSYLSWLGLKNKK